MNMHISHGWREKIGNTKHKNLHVARIHLPVSPREARETIYILKIFIAVLSNHVGIFFLAFLLFLYVNSLVFHKQILFACEKIPQLGFFHGGNFFPKFSAVRILKNFLLSFSLRATSQFA